MNVIVTDEAKKKIEEKKTDSAYCMLNICSTWGGSSIEPAVYVGEPVKKDDFDVFENNGVTVYVKKGTPCPGGTLTITTGTFLWFEKLIVEGMM